MSDYDSVVHHYPPDVTEILINALSKLCKYKSSVLTFFEGAGVPEPLLAGLRQDLARDPDTIKKPRMARVVLTALNADNESLVFLRARREIVKRVCEFEDFSLCWPDDQLPAKGLVAELRRVVNVKDSFSRMERERMHERQELMRVREAEAGEKRRREAEALTIKSALFALFGQQDTNKRGLALEAVLNRLFKHEEILVRESFRRQSRDSGRLLEQIDGVVELDGRVYLVEMKWLTDNVTVDDFSRHGMRVVTRPEAHGILVSYSDFTEAALQAAREALPLGKVFCFCMLQEIVQVVERGTSLKALLKQKIHAAVVDRNPFLDVRT